MDAAEMLTLAAITYRGCELNLADPHSRKIVYDEITRCLNSFSVVKGKWKLAWGPSGHCGETTASDDVAMMYVVRSRSAPSRLAIVVRGTNFFSVSDALGNLLIDTKPWEYGTTAGEIKVSHSTWFGLGILQRLRSGAIPAAPVEQTPAEKNRAAATAAKARLAYDLLTKIIQGTPPFDTVEYLAKIGEEIIAMRIRRALAPRHYANQLRHVRNTQPPAASGQTLIEFLKGFIADMAGEVNIYVVGHSKGGALAAAVALWLADTQGATAAQWDPASNAKLHLYSFAAPTPGNAGFADRFQQRIAEAYRLANPYDVVPHVWDPTEVKQIPDLYGDQLKELRIPVDLLVPVLEEVGYQHEASPAPWQGGAVAQSNCLQRAGVEHLDSYLKELGLYDGRILNTLALFTPI